MLASQKTRHAAFFTPDKCGDGLDAFIAKHGEVALVDRMAAKKKVRTTSAPVGICADLLGLMKIGREYTVTDLYWLMSQNARREPEGSVRAAARELFRSGYIEREYWNHNGDSFVLYRKEGEPA